MSSLQNLIDSITSLNSNKKREKLDAFEKLTGLLNQEKIVSNLHSNTLANDKSCNWDILFTNLHNASVTIADEKISKNKQVPEKHIQIIQNVVPLAVQKSVYEKTTLLDSNLLVSCILNVFEKDTRAKLLGSTYVNILTKYVLLDKKNWCSLKEENWIGLKNMCRNSFKNPPPRTPSHIFLEILCDVIKNSSKSCQSHGTFLDLFGFLKDVLLTNKKLGLPYEISLLRLTNMLCLQSAIEFRYTVCDFMEQVMDFIMDFCAKNNMDLSIRVYHFLMTMLSLHNPNGVHINDKAAYCNNLNMWKYQIKKIFFFCLDELQHVLRSVNDKNFPEFLDLFVDISHLVYINDLENFTEALEFDVLSDEPIPVKKCKYSFDTNHFTSKISPDRAKQFNLYSKFGNLFQDLKSSDGWFWLQFLEVLINKYPDDLKSEYQKLIEVLYDIICDKKDVNTLKISLRCLFYILKAESVTKSNDVEIKNQNDIWNNISKELVRYIQSENYYEVHVLLRELISHSKIYNPEPIFKIYCDGIAKSSLDNFKTLCSACQYYIVPEVIVNASRADHSPEPFKNVRDALIRWLLQEGDNYPAKDLAKILVSLSVKKFEEIEKHFDKTNILFSQVNMNDFCKTITNNYKMVAFRDLKLGESVKVPEENNAEPRVDNDNKFKLFGYLDVRWQSLYRSLNDESLNFNERLQHLENCFWFCELMCYLISYIDTSPPSPLDENQVLVEKLEFILSSCTTKTVELLKVKFLNLRSLFNFYASDFHVDVQKLIREPNFINLNLLQFLFEIFADRSEKTGNEENLIYHNLCITSDSKFSNLIKNTESNLHFQKLTEKEKVVVHAAEFLCQYITVPGLSESNHFQSTLALKIIDNLIKDDCIKDSSNFHLQLVFRVVYSFIEYDGISVAVLNGCLDLVSAVFDKKFSDLELLITVLQILQDFLPLVHRIGNTLTHCKFREIINDLRSAVVVKKNCGIKAVSKFVEFLGKISKYDLNGTWAFLESDGLNCLAFEEILSFLKHPFHEVRLTAALCVGSLFVYQENINESTIMWQKEAFKKLFIILKENNCTTSGSKGIACEYSSYVISSVTLISWANVICTSRFWRKKALFYMIYTAFLRQFKQSEVEDIIKLICTELSIGDPCKYVSYHFPYLFRKWNKKGLFVEDFPYYLLQYKEFEEFITNEMQSIVSVYCQSEQFDKVTTMAGTLKIPLSQIFKNCYPHLISFVLPNMNANVDRSTANKCKKIKKFLDMELPSKISVQLFADNLDKVIYNMIKYMFDPGYLAGLCSFSGNIKDDKKPLHFNGPQIVETLKSLSAKEGESLLEKIALEVPSLIEKIFLLLLGDIEEAFICDYKVFAFYKYIFFAEIVSEATSGCETYSRINAFIIRDVIYTLTAITKNNHDEILANMACECLRKIAEAYLPKFNGIFGEFLPLIASVLTPLAKSKNAKALNILNLLICQNYEKLEGVIVLLDPFPDDEIFREINEHIEKKKVNAKNLKSYIKQFIKSRNNKTCGCRIESLRYLRQMLSDKKDDLREMYENLSNFRGFSEDCKKSLLHQLICTLVELTSLGSLEVRMEAAKCLGELGPSDLTTLVLRPENDLTSLADSDSAIAKFFKSIIINLSDLLISDNYPVKKAASKALYATLSVGQTKKIFLSSDTNKNTRLLEYLEPFVPASYCDFQLKIKSDEFVNRLNDEELWKPDKHEKWIVHLVDVLLQLLSDSREIIDSYRKLVQLNWQFAENIFAILLDLILTSNDGCCRRVISKNFQTFFESYFNYTNKAPIHLSKKSVQCMLNVIDCIRFRRNHKGVYQQNFLCVNYLHVAKAALYCSAYFTSIFYAELWFEEKKKTNLHCTDLNNLCELFPEESTALTDILRECYYKIGNSDGIQGCGYMHLLNSSSEIQHYEHAKNWHLSILHHDVQLSMGNKDLEVGLLNSLERSGMIYVLNNLIKTDNLSQSTSLAYKCAAHLSDWTLLDSAHRTTNKPQTECFDKYYYFALKAFLNQDDATFQNETFKARRSVISELRNCSLESSKNLYLPLSDLQRLQELEEFVCVSKKFSKNDLWKLYTKWRKQDSIKYSDFKLIEAVWSSRTTFIKNSLEKANNSNSNIKDSLQSMLCEIYYKLIVAARKEKKYEVALRMLSYVNSIKAVPQEELGKLNLEKSRILWEAGDKEIGKFLLNHCIKKNNISGELKAKGLRIYGDWMVEAKSENSHEIIANYYLKSISQCKSSSSNLIDSYASLAKFADSNYEQLNEYLSSPLFETKKNLINTQNDLASELRQELGWNQNREKKIAYFMASRQVAIDENEIKNNKSERDSFLNLAIKYYLLTLKEGEKYNLLVFRVISLWLNNAGNQEVIGQLKKCIHQIPTYKFLCLLPQLIPRMADVCLISNLIERILQDHPYHTLPFLFAISNSYEDLKYNGSDVVPNTSRVVAAKSMLEKFQKDPRLKHFISEMDHFSTALIELANYKVSGREAPGTPISFPEHLKITKIENLKSVWVPTLHIPYEKNCKYDKIVSLHKFEKSFYLVGGVNLPKKITCVGSDGNSRVLLVKGRDDLRQDAVMQQVFGIINSLLSQNAETKKRKLVMRTYRVVPLSHRSGIIEWCESTQPLSLYLTGPDGKSGAHKKFNPDDILPSECRLRIKKVFSVRDVTTEDKLKVYLDICKEFHPALHYFFLEKFPAAGVWFERRLAYVHSVATSSMIGYILGIGDRHVQNILIDNLTAEVIHIDLGIAFEQGKTLPTPETVPFRLTRDIVDGMGLNGVEGDFRISCIKTMEVLRNNQDTILTLLEVLLYDPLYTWTITPEKAYSIQGHMETNSANTDRSSPDLETNKLAERALIRLKQKLQGIETNCMATNVDGQVSYLIQQARDPNNLCRLFHGWQAYL